MPKKRGAPPGNTNALKHGYYSRRFSPSRLSQALNDPTGVLFQIKLLRAYIVHIKTLSDQIGPVHDQFSLLSALTLALGSLHRLIRLYHAIPGTVDDKDSIRLALLKNMADLLTNLPTSTTPPPSPPPVLPSDKP